MTVFTLSADETVSTDVLIIGGGFVGGALACALGDAGIRSIVVDNQPLERLRALDNDGRASAISLTSRRLLEKASIWQGVGEQASPMLGIRVSDGNSRFFLHYDYREVGNEPFGHMVENCFLRRATVDRLMEHAWARFCTPAVVMSLNRQADHAEAKLSPGGRIRAPLVVAADGRNSTTREGANIRVTGWSYHQTGIICTVAHERPHQAVAQEHFLPAGPFAILPLNGNRSSIVWTERSELVPSIMASNNELFHQELSRRFGDFLGKVTVIGPRWSYPLSLQYSATSVARRLALVGDAAHAMHPIAGQGLNMGYRDVAALVDVLSKAKSEGKDIGSHAVLGRYERWRRFDNTTMLAATDGLNRLFSNDIVPLRQARDLGLAVVGRLPPVKRLFMRHAMGLLGDLPSLMQG